MSETPTGRKDGFWFEQINTHASVDFCLSNKWKLRRGFVQPGFKGVIVVAKAPASMRARVAELHRVLAPTGTFYLHCDWHASRYLKVMCDEVFESRNFQNEVVWYYRGGEVSPRRWPRRHDVLLFYTKGKDWTFNVDPVRMEYSPESQERLQYQARSFRKTREGDVRVYESCRPNPQGKHPDDVSSIQPANALEPASARLPDTEASSSAQKRDPRVV